MLEKHFLKTIHFLKRKVTNWVNQCFAGNIRNSAELKPKKVCITNELHLANAIQTYIWK